MQQAGFFPLVASLCVLAVLLIVCVRPRRAFSALPGPLGEVGDTAERWPLSAPTGGTVAALLLEISRVIDRGMGWATASGC